MFEPNCPTSQAGADDWSCSPEMGWVNYILWPRIWTWGAESRSFGYISWGQVTLWVVRQLYTEKQDRAGPPRLREEKRRMEKQGWRVIGPLSHGWPERRCLRGAALNQGILVSPEARNTYHRWIPWDNLVSLEQNPCASYMISCICIQLTLEKCEV